MICSQCQKPHRVMWIYTIRVGRSVHEKAVCNTCELEWLRAA